MIISVINEKGGVGKTTTVLELAYQAGAILGKKVLVIDLDGQANATGMLTGMEHQKSIFDLLLSTASLSEVAKPASEEWPNCLVLPADRRLGVIEAHLLTKLNRERLLKTILEPIKANFDFIFIDLPPAINTLSINALVASDAFLIPSDLSDYAKNGIKMVRQTADLIISSGNNPKLEFIGVILTSFQKGGSIAVRKLLEDLAQDLGEKLLAVKIPDSVKVTESQAKRIPVGLLDPECSVSESYKKLMEIFA